MRQPFMHMRGGAGSVVLRIRRVPLLCVLAWCTAALTGCDASASADKNASGGAAPAAQPVRVAMVESRPAPLALRAIGTVEALASVTIRSQVDGRLTKVAFKDGQEVRAGDVLLELDPRPSEAALKLAQANRARDQAMALDAQLELKRMSGLFATGTAADRELERAQADADAKAAQVQADDAMIEQATLELEYCTIRSPLTGRVGARLADPGDIVKVNETPLVVVNQIEPIYVKFSVAERHLAEIRQHASKETLVVEARYSHGDGTVERGTLTFTDNQVDPSTGMIRLKGTFANENGRMWPGQYVTVSLVLATRPEAIVVPTKALQAGPDGEFVFVVNANRTVAMRPVRVADALDGLSVIESGLTPGEQVVTDGQLRLTPGAAVEILANESASAAKPAEDVAAGGAGDHE